MSEQLFVRKLAQFATIDELGSNLRTDADNTLLLDSFIREARKLEGPLETTTRFEVRVPGSGGLLWYAVDEVLNRYNTFDILSASECAEKLAPTHGGAWVVRLDETEVARF